MTADLEELTQASAALAIKMFIAIGEEQVSAYCLVAACLTMVAQVHAMANCPEKIEDWLGNYLSHLRSQRLLADVPAAGNA